MIHARGAKPSRTNASREHEIDSRELAATNRPPQNCPARVLFMSSSFGPLAGRSVNQLWVPQSRSNPHPQSNQKTLATPAPSALGQSRSLVTAGEA